MSNTFVIIQSPNDLQHHGILGMKWGVRRYQNYDGTLTDAGKKRLEKSNIKVIKKDETQESKRGSITKKIAIGVGITATIAAGAYFVNRYAKMNLDSCIKSGTEIQHMAKSWMNENLNNNPFYASYLKRDNKVYAKGGFIGAHWDQKKILESSKDIKVAGKKTSLDAFRDVLNNESFKEKYPDLNPNDKKAVNHAYYVFNKNLTSPDMRDKKLRDEYFQRLKEKGYDAIRDRNDQVNTGTRSPIILFNNLEHIKLKDMINVSKKT